MWSKDERQLKQVDIWTSWRSSRKIGECNPSDRVCVGNSMICRDIWHKYREWYFEIVRQFWNISGGIYTKYHVQIMLLFVYTTTRKSFVIITCKYFKLSWNTTALSQSNCRNFSRSSIYEVYYTCVIFEMATLCVSLRVSLFLLSLVNNVKKVCFGSIISSYVHVKVSRTFYYLGIYRWRRPRNRLKSPGMV